MEEKPEQIRRQKRPVIGADGKVLNAQMGSDPRSSRTSSIMHIDYTPTPQKHPCDGAKRQYSWIHRPTAWDNPITYEDPPEPGKRPSHPVCANGIVATDRKRFFPDKVAETGIPPLHMSKAPVGNTWGGWAQGGAPGRAMMDGPWQVEPRERELEEGEEAEFRVSDMRVRRLPGMKNNDTAWLTQWHWDPRRDIDPPKINRFSLGFPNEACTTTSDAAVWSHPAGRAGNLYAQLQAEGCSLSLNGKVRAMDEARGMTPTPLSAR
jgi:hypothetical protein